MGEPSNYTFDLKEVAEMLVRKQGITDGQWLIGFEFIFTAGMMGPSSPEALPGTMTLINKVTLAKHPPGAPSSPLVVDAGALNSPPKLPKPSPRPRAKK